MTDTSTETSRIGQVWGWPFGAGLGYLLGALGSRLCGPAGDGAQLACISAGLFVAGVVCGFVWPSRAWRWGIATILLTPLSSMHAGRPIAGAVVFYLVTLVAAVVFVPVAIAGSYVGSSARTGRLRIPGLGRFGLGLLVGVVASVLPLQFTPRGAPRLFLLWVLALLLASCGLAVSHPHRPLTWGLSVGLGLPVVVVARILVDTIRLAQGAVWPEAEEHTLFPFEILFAIAIGLIAALPGAYLGSLLSRRFARPRQNRSHGT